MALIYENGMRRHSEGVATYIVRNHANLGESSAPGTGWELTYAGTPQTSGFEFKIQNTVYQGPKIGVLVYNGLEHTREHWHRPNIEIPALVLSNSLLRKLLGDNLDHKEVVFSPLIAPDSPALQVVRSSYFAIRFGELEKDQVDAIAESLAVHLLEKMNHSHKSVLKHLASKNHPEILLREILNEIHTHYLDENFNLDNLAKALGVSKFYLVRIMKAKFNCTPYAYVRRLRLQRAAGLLVSSDQPVTRIALDCGFNDSDSFNKAFKAWKGFPPSRLRA